MGKKIGAWCTGVACVVAVVVACVGCSSEPVSTDEDVTESVNSTDDSAAEEDIDWDAFHEELDELDYVNIAYSTEDAMAEIDRLSEDLSTAGVGSAWFSSLGSFALTVPRAEAEKAVRIAKMRDREGIEIVERDWQSTYGKRSDAAKTGEGDSVGEGDLVIIATVSPSDSARIREVLYESGLSCIIEGSVVYGVSVLPQDKDRAIAILRGLAVNEGLGIYIGD